MSHEVPFALATSHVHANDGFWPWDRIAQLILPAELAVMSVEEQ